MKGQQMTKLYSNAFIVLTALLLAGAGGFADTKNEFSYINEADYTEDIRVACVGDSITAGGGIKDRKNHA